MTQLTEHAKAGFLMLPEGIHTFRPANDGTYDILDVPVFSVMPKGTKGSPVDITEEVLRATVLIHQAKWREDHFLAPLNILHNGGMTKATKTGFFIPREVRPFRFDGKVRATVFADLLRVPEHVFRMIEAGELPYRSVEIRSWDPLVFGACSLLDTQDPFWQYPILTSETMQPITNGRELSTTLEAAHAPALATFSADIGSAVLFKFEEKTMPDDPKPAEKKDGEEPKMEAGDELSALVKQIESKMKEFEPLLALIPKLQALVAGGGEGEGEGEAEGEGTPVQMNRGKPQGDGASAGSSALEMRVRTLESAVRHGVREKETDTLFQSALKALDGWELDEKDEADLRHFASQGKENLDRFVALFQRDVPKEPAGDLLELGDRLRTQDSEVLAQFTSPDDKARARELLASRKRLEEQGFSVASEADFLAINMPQTMAKALVATAGR